LQDTGSLLIWLYGQDFSAQILSATTQARTRWYHQSSFMAQWDMSQHADTADIPQSSESALHAAITPRRGWHSLGVERRRRMNHLGYWSRAYYRFHMPRAIADGVIITQLLQESYRALDVSE